MPLVHRFTVSCCGREAKVDQDGINLCNALNYFTLDENYARLIALGSAVAYFIIQLLPFYI